jgi:hypothetical protein
VSTFTTEALRELNAMFLDNMNLRVIVDNMTPEWAVQYEDGAIYGTYTTEAEAVKGLRKLDQEDPEAPAFIVSRQVGPWVKRAEESTRPPRTRAYTVDELDVEAFRRILRER